MASLPFCTGSSARDSACGLGQGAQHLLQLPGLRLIDRAEPLGAVASRAFYAELAADPTKGPRLDGIMASARDGVVTPSNPEMGRFWAAMKTALTNFTEGRQTPQQALDAAARRILQG